MKKETKIKIAITSGIIAVILLILLLVLTLSGKGDDADKLNENISEYANTLEDEGDSLDGASTGDGENKEDQTSEDAADEDKENAAAGAEDTASADGEAISEYLDPAKNSVSGNSFYATNTAILRDKYKTLKYDAAAQLQEMFTYWNDGNLDAVRDLAHLPRFEAMSYDLKDGKDFIYYGDLSSEGKPEGKGKK